MLQLLSGLQRLVLLVPLSGGLQSHGAPPFSNVWNVPVDPENMRLTISTAADDMTMRGLPWSPKTDLIGLASKTMVLPLGTYLFPGFRSAVHSQDGLPSCFTRWIHHWALTLLADGHFWVICPATHFYSGGDSSSN